MSTTAISYRRGTYSETSGWVGGAEGEITVDTTNQTLWVHDGNGVGTELAKADLTNVSSSIITNNLNATILTSSTYKLLTYDLNNFRGQDYSGYYIPGNDNNPTLGYAIASYLDLPTNTSLGNTYALTNLSNINTVNLATNTGHSGRNLAYSNFHNFHDQDWDSSYDAVHDTNTALGTEIARYLGLPSNLSGYVTQSDLATELSSYATSSDLTTAVNNINNNFSNYQETQYKSFDITLQNDNTHYPTNLAVYTYVTTYVPSLLSGYEDINNKVSIIDNSTIDSIHYPTTQAVDNFVSDKIDNTFNNFVDRSLINIIDWNMATSDSSVEYYEYDVNPTTPGSGYSVGDTITTNISYVDPDTQTTEYFKIEILSTDNSGGAIDAVLSPDVMNVNVSTTYTDSTYGGIFDISSTLFGRGGELVDLHSPQTISDKYFNNSQGDALDTPNSLLTTKNISKSLSGYVELGNGIIMQWGTYTTTSTTDNIQLPTSFNGDYSVTANVLTSSVDACSVGSKTNSSFDIVVSTAGTKLNWIAIGY